MEKLSSLFGRLALTVAGALALGACNRAEYAMLPPSASYLGTKPAAYVPRSAAPAPVAAQPAPIAPAATNAPPVAEIATKQATPSGATAPAKAVEAQPIPAAPVAAQQPAAAATATSSSQPKLSLMQRLALHKVLRKIDNQAQKIAPRRSDNTASTARVDGKLRYAIIFGAISLIFFVIGGGVGNFVGTILLIIALLFLVFWLLDAL